MSVLTVCEDCGRRYFSEVAKEQLTEHLKSCEPYQSALAEKAKALGEAEPAPDDPEYEAPDAARRKAAAKKSK